MDKDLSRVLEQSAREAREDEDELLVLAISASLVINNVSRVSSDSDKWPCRNCTYKNKDSQSSCDMCDSPRMQSAKFPSPRTVLGAVEYERALRAQLIAESASGGGGGGGATSSASAPTSVPAAESHNLFMSQSDYDEALRAQLIADSFNEDWIIDPHSADSFDQIWGDEDTPPPPSGDRRVQDIVEVVFRRTQTVPRVPTTDLRTLVTHGHNVHAAAVEEVAFQTISEIVAIPLPAGISADQMVSFAIDAIRGPPAPNGLRTPPAGLPSRIADAACAELSNNSTLMLQHKNQTYKTGKLICNDLSKLFYI